MSFTSDWLFPPFQSQEIVNALIAAGKPVSYCNVQSDCGHDAFLLPDNLATYGEMMRAFLANLDGDAWPKRPTTRPSDAADGEEPARRHPTSIFHRRAAWITIRSSS